MVCVLKRIVPVSDRVGILNMVDPSQHLLVRGGCSPQYQFRLGMHVKMPYRFTASKRISTLVQMFQANSTP